MKSIFIFIGVSVLLAILALAYPELMLNPGPLTKGHHGLGRSCLSCHAPFSGASSARCLSCHQPDDIGIRSVSGKLLPENTSRVAFHRGLPKNSCIECHTDHKGRLASKAIKTFRHEYLSPSLSNNCRACHLDQKPADRLHRLVDMNCVSCHSTREWKPALFRHDMLDANISSNCSACHKADRPLDSLHRNTGENCAVCHRTGAWKPATFDHKRLGAGTSCVSCHKADRPLDSMHRNTGANCAVCHRTVAWKPATFDHGKLIAGTSCISCHKADLPNDRMHADAGTNCTTCHGTRAWKPSTFNHERFFRLDGDHRAGCRTCHADAGNYKKYSCYGCHEHSPASIAAEHREEGIANYQNCVKCHRSADEQERDD
ncbi:MAG: hypothetical protein HGA56_09150 [Chlorobiaceae bacterium]|nr:hypothetical protein [Chlorobiaceae bacterium]